ncbi:hypothetical protein GH733_012568 [Mirounga leonina]|nr:hypothetical protein GH733_012568 [Mirounga leonina]
MVGRYTTSHQPLDSGVQQCRLRHGGPWTFQQAPVPASPSDCGWFQPCPGTERMQLLRGKSWGAGRDRAGGPGADPPHRLGCVLLGPAVPSGARGCGG